MTFFRFCLVAAVVAALSPSAAALDLRDETFVTKGAGKVIFSHRNHIGQGRQKNNCKACHNDIFSMKNPVRYTMADMEKGKSCGACHDGTSAFPLRDCVRCHTVRDVTMPVGKTGTVRFTHRQHAERQPCDSCHPRLFRTGRNKPVGMSAMEGGKSCGACHDGKEAFTVRENCGKCHQVGDVKIPVPATGPVRFRHRTHAEKCECTTCHPALYPAGGLKPVGMAAMEKGKSCGVCHDGSKVFPLTDCTRCHPVKELTFKVKGIATARFSHARHGSVFRCDACHPAIYPAKRNKPVGMAAMEKGKSCGACHDGKGAFSVKEQCEACH